MIRRIQQQSKTEEKESESIWAELQHPVILCTSTVYAFFHLCSSFLPRILLQ